MNYSNIIFLINQQDQNVTDVEYLRYQRKLQIKKTNLI